MWKQDLLLTLLSDGNTTTQIRRSATFEERASRAELPDLGRVA